MQNNTTYHDDSAPEYEIPLEIGRQSDQIDENLDEEELKITDEI